MGDELSIPGWTLRVWHMDGRRVDRVRFVPAPEPSADAGADSGGSDPADDRPAGGTSP